jgi:hypothetical protein
LRMDRCTRAGAAGRWIKLALTTTPLEMTLGAAVIGKARLEGDDAIVLPMAFKLPGGY